MIGLGVVHRDEQPGRRGRQPEPAERRRERHEPRGPAREKIAPISIPPPHHVCGTAPRASSSSAPCLRHQRARGIGEDQMLELGDRLRLAVLVEQQLPPAPARPPARCPVRRALAAALKQSLGVRRLPGRGGQPAGQQAHLGAALGRRQAARRLARVRPRPCWCRPARAASSAWPSAGRMSASIGCSSASSDGALGGLGPVAGVRPGRLEALDRSGHIAAVEAEPPAQGEAIDRAVPGDRRVGARQVTRLDVTQRQPAPERRVLLARPCRRGARPAGVAASSSLPSSISTWTSVVAAPDAIVPGALRSSAMPVSMRRAASRSPAAV